MKLAIFGIVFILVLSVLVLMPTITINSAAVISSSAYAYIRSAMYFLPIGTVTVILSLIISFWVVRIVIALAKTIWDVLPVV